MKAETYWRVLVACRLAERFLLLLAAIGLPAAYVCGVPARVSVLWWCAALLLYLAAVAARAWLVHRVGPAILLRRRAPGYRNRHER